MSVRPFAFVLMPFDEAFEDVYRLGIKSACEDAGIIAERVDEQIYSETILDRIYRQIKVANFVIADMTGKNPNVFYEVGYAHAIGKSCTLLTQTAEDIPFDLKQHRHIVYGGSIQRLKASLAADLEWQKAKVESSKSQALTLNVASASGSMTKKDWSIDGAFNLNVDLHNNTVKRSPEIESIYVYTSFNWRFSQGGEECPVTEVTDGPSKYKTYVKPPVSRLSPSGWAQFKLKGSRQLWNKWNGAEAKETYTSSGPLNFELHTSEGILRFSEHVTVEFDDFPF